jgi:hypothetical protein
LLQHLIDGNLNLININFLTVPIMVILLLVVVCKIVATALMVGSGGAREGSLPLLNRRLSRRTVPGRDQPVFPGAMPAPPAHFVIVG